MIACRPEHGAALPWEPPGSPMGERRTYRMAGEAVEVSAHRGYELCAPLYDDEDNPLFEAEKPTVAEMLRGLRYTNVLDAASGTGRHALRLASAGVEVTAVDQSAAMMAISRARAERERLNVRHVLASIEQQPLASQRFVLVLCWPGARKSSPCYWAPALVGSGSSGHCSHVARYGSRAPIRSARYSIQGNHSLSSACAASVARRPATMNSSPRE